MICPDADRSNKFQKKLLTRRANQGYVDIIAEIVRPRRETGSGFFVRHKTIDQKSFNSSN
jgi:hypothetical protein